MNVSKAACSSSRLVAQSASNASSRSLKPQRYSRLPSGSQNGLPSKSKKRSPGDGSGRSANPDAGCGVRSFQLSSSAEPRLELQRSLVVEPLEGRLGHLPLGRCSGVTPPPSAASVATPRSLELLDLAATDPRHAREMVDRVPVRVAERLEGADAALRAGERLGRGRRADELLEPLAARGGSRRRTRSGVNDSCVWFPSSTWMCAGSSPWIRAICSL